MPVPGSLILFHISFAAESFCVLCFALLQSQPSRRLVLFGFFNGKRGEFAFRIIILCVILLAAGVSDFRCRKVYNGWLFMGMAAGVIFWGTEFLLPAGIVLVPAFLLFRLRLMGAGDAKLMALIAGYLGIDAGIEAIGAGLLAGAAWSLCRLLHDRDLRVRLMYLTVYFRRVFLSRMITAYEMPSREDGREQVPLATCLAVGTYLYLLLSRVGGSGKGIL